MVKPWLNYYGTAIVNLPWYNVVNEPMFDYHGLIIVGLQLWFIYHGTIILVPWQSYHGGYYHGTATLVTWRGHRKYRKIDNIDILLNYLLTITSTTVFIVDDVTLLYWGLIFKTS